MKLMNGKVENIILIFFIIFSLYNLGLSKCKAGFRIKYTLLMKNTLLFVTLSPLSHCLILRLIFLFMIAVFQRNIGFLVCRTLHYFLSDD
jgi:hypothetical protein